MTYVFPFQVFPELSHYFMSFLGRFSLTQTIDKKHFGCIIFMVNFMIYITNSEDETLKLALDFASSLNKNDVVVLSGELGAGKTRFMYGIATFFNIQKVVCSPTFTIVNEYELPHETNGIKKIFHFDVYRIHDSIDFLDSIGTDYFSNGLCILEWGKNIKDILPPTTIYIDIAKDSENENKRTITITKGDNV